MSTPLRAPTKPLRKSRSRKPLLLVKGASTSPIAEDVLRGLTSTPKTLSPALFYDERGSQLFDEITRQPEYYLTRAERSIFASRSDEIIAAARGGQRLSVLELGAGSAEKTGLLLQAAVRAQGSVVYQPIDVSASALEGAVETLGQAIPGLKIEPLVADYTHGYATLPRPEGRRLALYIGSSIGNFRPKDAVNVLRELRGQLQPGDSLLIGTDLRKDPARLLAAYDDAAGVTKAFNKNMLARINREMLANFKLEQFRHEARWNPAASRIEMHLVSKRSQQVKIGATGLAVHFDAGESIHTENSYKFTRRSVAKLLATSGFHPAAQWTDSENLFLVTLAAAN